MQTAERFRKIDGHTLKLIACAVMLIDHIAAGIILPVVREGLYPDSISFETIKFYYDILRGIGRSAFPIFCYLLAEGFIHTKSRLRYALSLFIFGIISEPVYDAVFYGKKNPFNIHIFELLKENSEGVYSHCNVYFTLLIGLLVIWSIDRSFYLVKKLNANPAFAVVMSGLAIFLGIYVAEKLHTDYHGYGVALIVIFYVFRLQEPIDLIVGYILLCCFGTEYLAFPAFGLLYLHNKKRGRKLGRLKYLFYAFYPVHLLVIYLIRCKLYG